MNTDKFIINAQGQCELFAELNFHSVPQLELALKNFLLQLPDQQLAIVDLSQVKLIDNIGIALLVELTRYAHMLQKPLVFVNLTTQILALIKVNHLEQLLPLNQLTPDAN